MHAIGDAHLEYSRVFKHGHVKYSRRQKFGKAHRIRDVQSIQGWTRNVFKLNSEKTEGMLIGIQGVFRVRRPCCYFKTIGEPIQVLTVKWAI